MSDTFKPTPRTPLRKLIVARVPGGKGTIPRFRVTSVDRRIQRPKEWRRRHPAVHCSINNFLIKVCATTLIDMPAANVQWPS
jgi:hypothetical protein